MKFLRNTPAGCLICILALNMPLSAQMLVKDIYPGIGSSTPDELTNVNGVLYFVADDGVHGRELWKSDGTAAGTILVKDIVPGTRGSIAKNLISINGKLLFTATNPNLVDLPEKPTKLWKSDGTDIGTKQLKDGTPVQLESTNPVNLTVVGGRVYCTTTRVLGGNKNSGLMTSDGSDYPGTRILETLPFTDSLLLPSQFTNFKGALYYVCNSGLRKVNVSENGSYLIKMILPEDNKPDTRMQHLISVEGKLFFTANHNGLRRLWISDGTAGEKATFMPFDGIGNPQEAPNPANLINYGGKLYYSSLLIRNASSYWALFKSKPTDSTMVFGTFVQPPTTQEQALSNVNIKYTASAIASGTFSPSNFLDVNGTLYFVFAGYLWKSNGTAAGTVQVANTLGPSNLTNVNGTLYFVNMNSAIHKTDPSTSTATSVFKSPHAISNLTHVDGKVFYTSNDLNSSGTELFRLIMPK
jgi:ELWxxDGT repeat protein